MATGLYIHMPFCRQRCHYCDFNTYAGIEALIPEYLSALASELEQASHIIGAADPLTSMYLGGGTPSLLTGKDLEALMSRVRALFVLSSDTEISMEINPGALQAGELQKYAKAGVNRISVGVQAIQNTLLKSLGRIHTFEEACQSLEMCKNTGINRLSVDLMFGLPGQTMGQWQESLRWAAAQGIGHVSFYGLTLEKGTAFYDWEQSGRLRVPNDDVQAEMYEWGRGYLESQGFIQYEISNFSLPGQESRHNILYWENKTTLGVGAGAWSFCEGERSCNEPSPVKYVEKVMAGIDLKVERHHLKGRAARGEEAYLRLRLSEGIDLNAWHQAKAMDLRDDFMTEIQSLKSLGFLLETSNRLYIPADKRILANEVFERFVVEE
jgi:oxygen-independent coproporphyrinogen-3 oxidase